ncbi:endonuclease/exonuclease/phosphatase family protein [Spirillospora sp. NPDC048911]|uniref:endonuclease/exonuclease/phosphatase family protein n=1 Tax=Spirillospora sp. NPDC048911 TaxID=3364527 RepID=UPI00372161D2
MRRKAGKPRAAALLGVVIALVAALAPASGGIPDRAVPAGAATATVKIHHYNLCQGNFFCASPRGAKYRQGALDHLRASAAADRPWFISVNEICRTDFERLRLDLKTEGVYQEADGRHPLCGSGGGSYGIAMFAPGGVIEKVKPIALPNPGLNCALQECRWALCLRVTTYAGPMTACTAHLETDGEVAPKQASVYYKEARAFDGEGGPGRRMVLAGDFNITPDQLPPEFRDMVDLVQTGTDADGEVIGTFPSWTRNGGGAKATKHIDYILVERGVGIPRSFYPYCSDPEHPDEPLIGSDHCFTKGYWEL